ncbi:hypothetical protein Lser_V15G20088 [Lactuca serriola]
MKGRQVNMINIFEGMIDIGRMMQPMAMSMEIVVILRNPNPCCNISLFYIKEVAENTCVILDPVYTYGMMEDMTESPRKWERRDIMLIHTRGLLGLFDKNEEEIALMVGGWYRLELHESIPRKDDTEEITLIDPTFVECLDQINKLVKELYRRLLFVVADH